MKRVLRLFAAGSLSVAVFAFVLHWAYSPLGQSELQAAIEPLYQTPLSQLAQETETTVRIPVANGWNRLPARWPDPQFSVYAAHAMNIICPEHIGLRVSVQINGRTEPLVGLGDPPYGYSSSCTKSGVTFAAMRGDTVTIRLRVEKTTYGYLFIAPRWINTKDRLVGVQLDRLMYPFVRGAAILGLSVGLIAFSLSFVHSRSSGKQVHRK